MANNLPPDNYSADIAAIAAIPAVPTILEVVCRTTGMGFAAVARVTEDRWIACGVKDDIAFGLKPGGELKIETTICDEIRDSRQAVVIDHVAEDTEFRDHKTPKMYGFQSYISMPILLADGTFFGTLCAIDPRPARLKNPAVIGMFKLFAELIAFHLDAHARLTTSAADLHDAQASEELREQFIAVLGHDLKNPLAAILAGADALAKMPQEEKARIITRLIADAGRRMNRLVNDVLDFARGRLGQGVTLRLSDAPSAPILEEVIAELRAAHPGREIEASFAPAPGLKCDGDRLAQLLSNLVGNALHHGANDRPVKVESRVKDGLFELSVANQGAAIPQAIRQDLFKPYFRAAKQPDQQGAGAQGLGLGLYIAAEIAKAHGGTLSVASSEAETRFTFAMRVG